jgi:ABC-type multidrug transport system fused ATPase/permease subunit
MTRPGLVARLPDTNVFSVLHTNRRLIGLSYRILAFVVAFSVISSFAQAGFLLVVVRALAALTAETESISGSVGPFNATDLTIGQLIGIGFAFLAALVIAEMATTFAQASLQTNAERFSRRRMLNFFSAAPYDKQLELPRGDSLTLILDHTGGAAAVVGNLALGLSSLVNFGTLVGAAVFLSPLAAAVIIMGLVFMLGLLRPIIAMTRRHAARKATLRRSLGTLLAQRLELNRELRALGVDDQADAVILRTVEETARATRSLFVSQRAGTVMYRAGSFALVLGMLVLIDVSNASNLAALTAALLMLIRSMSYGQALQSMYQSVTAGVPVIEQLRDETRRLAQPDVVDVGDDSLPSDRPEVSLHDVTFAYPKGEPVLHDVSLAIEWGEFVALVGPSGAGKSTIMELLLGLRHPTSGRVVVDALAMQGIKPTWLRDHIAYVPQEPKLQSGTVADAIRFYRPNLSDSDVETAAKQARIASEIREWPAGFATEVGQLGDQLSGGQRQRIAIARALVGRPKILLMDEPTSSLDPVSERLIAQTLEELRGQMTIVVIAHRLHTVEGADRAVLIDHGRIVPQEHATMDAIRSFLGDPTP